MSKIPNWSQESDLNWKNDITDAQVSVFNFDDGSGNSLWAFTVQEEDSLEDERPYAGPDFETKENVVDAARNWMKDHPFAKADTTYEYRKKRFGMRGNVPWAVLEGDEYGFIEYSDEQELEPQGVEVRYRIKVPEFNPDAQVALKRIDW